MTGINSPLLQAKMPASLISAMALGVMMVYVSRFVAWEIVQVLHSKCLKTTGYNWLVGIMWDDLVD